MTTVPATSVADAPAIVPADYFERFLGARMRRPLLEGYEGLSAAFVVRFTDGQGCWRVTVERGAIVALAPAADPDAAPVRFDVTAPVFARLVTGALSPQAAFFQRLTDIRGDLFLGMKLARILGLFFAAHPYAGGGGGV